MSASYDDFKAMAHFKAGTILPLSLHVHEALLHENFELAYVRSTELRNKAEELLDLCRDLNDMSKKKETP